MNCSCATKIANTVSKKVLHSVHISLEADCSRASKIGGHGACFELLVEAILLGNIVSEKTMN
jgi:hypothetical protein